MGKTKDESAGRMRCGKNRVKIRGVARKGGKREGSKER